MRYRASNKKWYWYGCIEYGGTYVYTASSPTGPWTQAAKISQCYYDAGLLIDDNDTMYIAYGNTQLSVAQLSADGLSQVKTSVVYNTPSSIGVLEGSRMYKRNGYYYIFSTRPANGQYILKASSPFGPYTVNQVLLNLGSPVPSGGVPHQGSLVETAAGSWYYMAFVDSYPGGRIPVLAPVSWGSDGFPTIQLVNNAWGTSYTAPLTLSSISHVGTDSFSGTSLSAEWEWNHNPDTTKFSVSNGLTLNTATVTSDLYHARNTLSHRILGPTSSGTIVMDVSSMADGDRAGFAMLRDTSAWIGVVKTGTATKISMTSGLTMTSNWATSSTGSEVASASISATKIWLRIYADIHVGSGKTAKFYYSTDGSTFKQLGSALTLNSAWNFFPGYRYAIFNFATKALGGKVKVSSFTVDSPGETTGPATGGGASTPGTTAVPGTTLTTSKLTTSAPVSSTSAAGGSGGVAQFGQCGGAGWAGSTTCASPYKCTYSNDYYSQCL
ncbi:putative xylosidase/glycosyl hydrolase [Rhexocercosporidium sp. MPI-PUGE-AT-0058]|nr:putative xylosidase/glycosyl hydrolase [Rhexocercosporidium sp. MPI-PUGE-AT-0058]